MSTTRYEITVRGRLGDALSDAFGELTATPTTAATVIRGDIDQPALHGVLERIDALGLELLDVRRTTR
ncbi:MAG: hypothetical protein M3389_09010 [Actinomycetota bacterium]|nr:hypothetical protein [Actinomycetota bacterium]